MQTIADQLKSALETIEQTTLCANRPPNSVQLLAVSKTKPVSDIVLAYEAGQRRFGENYVQEGVEKIQHLQELSDIEWHFIGPLQSNKSNLVAEHFDWVQSIDRMKIASRLSQQRPAGKRPLQVCIQVNISGEESKSGINAAELLTLAAHIESLPNLRLRGIMAIPEASDDEQQQMAVFTRLHSLFKQLQAHYPQVDTLSMGMSGDLHSAIKAGSTMVRLGTAIFGHRG